MARNDKNPYSRILRLCSIGMGYFCTHYQIDKDMCESISKISAILIMLILLGAFIVGYINEIISGGIEYILYCCGFPRPSRLVLNKSFKRFSIEKISDLRHKLQLPEQVSLITPRQQKVWHRQNKQQK